MAYTFSIRHRFSGKVLHVVQTGDRKVELCAPDLSGLDLSNLILNEADLEWANLSNANLLGTKLKGASLFHANFKHHCDSILRRVRVHNLNAAKLIESYRRTVLAWGRPPKNRLLILACA